MLCFYSASESFRYFGYMTLQCLLLVFLLHSSYVFLTLCLLQILWWELITSILVSLMEDTLLDMKCVPAFLWGVLKSCAWMGDGFSVPLGEVLVETPRVWDERCAGVPVPTLHDGLFMTSWKLFRNPSFIYCSLLVRGGLGNGAGLENPWSV